ILRRRKRRKLLQSVIEFEADDSPLRDTVFLSFVSGRNSGKLAVTIPHRLMRIFLPSYREAKPSAVLFNLSKRALESIVTVAHRKRERTDVNEESDSGSPRPPDGATGHEPRSRKTFSLRKFLSKYIYNDLAIDFGVYN